MQTFPLDNPRGLRNLAAKFKQTAHAATGVDPTGILDVLALELLIKADLIERLTNTMTDLGVS